MCFPERSAYELLSPCLRGGKPGGAVRRVQETAGAVVGGKGRGIQEEYDEQSSKAVEGFALNIFSGVFMIELLVANKWYYLDL